MGKLNKYYGKLLAIDNEIKDICLELNDIGINTWVTSYKVEIQHSQDSSFNIAKLMNYNDVHTVVERIVYYLQYNNYNVTYKYSWTYPSDKLAFFNNIINKLKGKVYYVSIHFDKI